MFHSIIVLFLVPSSLARSPVKQGDQLGHLFDRMSRSLLADLHMDHDVPVSSEPDTTARWTSGYKMRSTGEDGCTFTLHIEDQFHNAVGVVYVCEGDMSPAYNLSCLQTMNQFEDGFVFMQVCPIRPVSSIKSFGHTVHGSNQNSGSPLAYLQVGRTTSLREQGYNVRSFEDDKCPGYYCIEDEYFRGVTGCLYTCYPYEFPKIEPNCWFACGFKEELTANSCLVICPPRQMTKPSMYPGN